MYRVHHRFRFNRGRAFDLGYLLLNLKDGQLR